ncbi:MAG: hypothetical protein ABL921_13590 [Pirellula sp.]
MKLRRNYITPLRFDPSGAIDDDAGIGPAQLQAMARRLVPLRDAMTVADRTASDCSSVNVQDSRTGPSAVLGLPKKLLQEYEASRRTSELGRLFQRATHLHRIVDRVVVLGKGRSLSGAKAILDACCQPYWNDLTRADRGSKPRMFFDGDGFDNDATQALLHLLDVHKCKRAQNEMDRWALVVIDRDDVSRETSVAFRQFLAALEISAGGDCTKLIDLLIPITRSNSQLHRMASQLGGHDIFSMQTEIVDGYTVLSFEGLVPAAMLGVNVIELLQGAAAMSEHFASAPPEDNIVLQFVAAHCAPELHCGETARELKVWNKALLGFSDWYEQLFGSHRNRCPARFQSEMALRTPGRQTKSIVSIIQVDDVRFDPLTVGKRESDEDLLNEIADRTLPELSDVAAADFRRELTEQGRLFTTLHVPRIDELHMGQLFQLMMLAGQVENHLLDS